MISPESIFRYCKYSILIISSNFRHTSVLLKKLHWKDQFWKGITCFQWLNFILHVTYLNLYFVQKKQKGIFYLSHKVRSLICVAHYLYKSPLFKSVVYIITYGKRRVYLWYNILFLEVVFKISDQQFEDNLFSPTQQHSMQNYKLPETNSNLVQSSSGPWKK